MNHQLSDPEIAQQFFTGSDQLKGRLVCVLWEKYFGYLDRYLQRHFPGCTLEDREDMIALLFGKDLPEALMQEEGRFQEESAILRWLLVSCRYRGLNFTKKQKKAQLEFLQYQNDVFGSDRETVSNPDFHFYEEKDEMEPAPDLQIRLAIALLNDRQREAVIQFHYQHRSYRKIAQSLELSEGAVRGVLNRGKKRLGELTDNFMIEPAVKARILSLEPAETEKIFQVICPDRPVSEAHQLELLCGVLGFLDPPEQQLFTDFYCSGVSILMLLRKDRESPEKLANFTQQIDFQITTFFRLEDLSKDET